MNKINPFEECPIYETERFILRKTIMEDASDLLQCYSDERAVKFFNADNCHTDFNFKTLEEMKLYMKVWEREYEENVYVRFSIVDKTCEKVVGTLEFCPWRKEEKKFGNLAVMRIDLASSYETKAIIIELIEATIDHMYELFDVEKIFIKAIPEAKERINALHSCGFSELEDKVLVPFSHYYIR